MKSSLQAANNNEVVDFKRDFDRALIAMCEFSLSKIDQFNSLGLGEISPTYKVQIKDLHDALSANNSCDLKHLSERAHGLANILAEIRSSHFSRYLD